jgi:signal transduction histidine kinase/CheY-like chemotaxis protein
VGQAQQVVAAKLRQHMVHELQDRLRRALIAQSAVLLALAYYLGGFEGWAVTIWAGSLTALWVGRAAWLTWRPDGKPDRRLWMNRLGSAISGLGWAWGLLLLGTQAPPHELAVLWIVAAGVVSAAGYTLHLDPPSYYVYAGPFWLAATAMIVAGLPFPAVPIIVLASLFAAHLALSVQDRHRRVRDLLQANEELRLAREEAEAGLQAQQAFLANMSHEIRTPLNGILGMTDLLLRGRLDSDQVEQAGTIKTCGSALLEIIDEILDYSKIRSEMLELESTDYDLVTLVDQALEILTQSAREKGLRLAAVVDPAVPRLLRGDPVRLRQVLVNLGSNAVKFTEAGEVVLRVDRVEGAPGVPRLRFAVTDTGSGIPQDKLAVLFQPFVQADPSTTRRHGGTGLGLSISRSLVEKMGGTISCESEPDRGSSFRFELPLCPGEGRAPSDEPPPSLAKRRVLIAHESVPVREMLVASLERAHVAVDVEEDPARAASRLAEREPGLEAYALVVLSDSIGQERTAALGRVLRPCEPDDGPAVVLASGSGIRGDLYRYVRQGFAGFLSLPTRQDLLLATLDSALTGDDLQIATERRTAKGVALPPQTRRRTDEDDVLVVEDNPVNQRVIARMLQELGYAVRLCSTGREALGAWKQHRPSLILCDVQMPDMDGLEVTREIRAREAPAERTPIVALTAGALAGDREVCLEAGMDDYLTKPISVDALAQALDRWVARGSTGASCRDRPASEEP